MSDPGDEVDRLEEPVKIPEVKQKRQLSQKQLDNLSKAREKAKVVLAAKRERTQKLQKEERKLKQLKMKDREDKVAAEMRLLQSEQTPEVKPRVSILKPPTEKTTKKPKKPKVVYYSSSSSSCSSCSSTSSDDSSSEEEVQYRHRPRYAKTKRTPPKNLPPRPRAPPPPSAQSENDDAMIEHQYQQNLRKMKREMIMRSVFPGG